MAAVSVFLEVLVCVLLVFCAGGGLSEEKSSSKILHLNDENFDDVVGKSELILVEFYVDWWAWHHTHTHTHTHTHLSTDCCCGN